MYSSWHYVHQQTINLLLASDVIESEALFSYVFPPYYPNSVPSAFSWLLC
jgi:hypothetical protein